MASPCNLDLLVFVLNDLYSLSTVCFQLELVFLLHFDHYIFKLWKIIPKVFFTVY
jgi:hypothetical protein